MNSGRRVKGDVLGTILGEPQLEETIPGLEELTTLIERYSTPLLSREPLPPSPRKKAAASDRNGGKKTNKGPPKKKTTHYLTKNVYRELDEAKQFLQGLLPPGSKLLASKSKIVNYALQTLLEDFEAKGNESELVKKLLKEKGK